MVEPISDYTKDMATTVSKLQLTLDKIGSMLKEVFGHILILDDSECVLKMMEGVLNTQAELKGAILTAATMEEAQILIEQYKDINLAIVDYYLDKGPAEEAMLKMKAAGIKIICVSGDVSGVSDKFCKDHNIIKYSKPVRVSSLMNDIKNLLSEGR